MVYCWILHSCCSCCCLHLVCADIMDPVFDIAAVTSQLRALKPDCGWLMLVDGQQKINNSDFVAAAGLLRDGT